MPVPRRRRCCAPRRKSRNVDDEDKTTSELIKEFGKAIRIADDGVGFDAAVQLGQSLRNRRMGLWSMKSRVEIMQGVLELKTSPGKGASIAIVVPVKSRPASAKSQQTLPDAAAM